MSENCDEPRFAGRMNEATINTSVLESYNNIPLSRTTYDKIPVFSRKKKVGRRIAIPKGMESAEKSRSWLSFFHSRVLHILSSPF